jgi:hypothetical protein
MSVTMAYRFSGSQVAEEWIDSESSTPWDQSHVSRRS